MFIAGKAAWDHRRAMLHVGALTVSTLAAASAASATHHWLRQGWRRPPEPSPKASLPGLRIALFSGNYNCVRDGANQALNRLVEYLIAVEGAEVRVYSPVVEQPAFAPAGTLIGVPSLPIPGRSEYRVALGLPRTIARDLIAFAPDIVHVSAPDLLGRAAQRFARRQGLPIVASVHTRFETYFDYYGLGKFRPAIEHWLRAFYQASDSVLVPTTAIQQAFDASGLAGRTRLWSRGVDPDLFSPHLRDVAWRRLQGYADDEVVPLFFGRLVREKGLAQFAAAISEIRARGHNVRPLVVGDGPARGWFGERLPNAVFTGHLSGTALGCAVASADILLNPSLTEAFGNVTLEAMASGLAVLCPDVGSTRDLIRDGHSGVLVKPDAVAMADALEILLRDPVRREAMGRAAAFQSARFSWSRVHASVADAYRAAIEGKRRKQK